jgi:hypothetical protein
MNFKNANKIQKTNFLPLRWVSNILGELGGWALLRVAYLDEIDNFGFKYKFYSFIYSITWPIYNKFGTFYEIYFDMDNKIWDDYDENGIPYWEKTGTVDPEYNPWDFVDDETGDAFKVIKNGIK